ncbi:MAG: DUF3267 domain-containing protein [Chthonomonadales bacterium]
MENSESKKSYRAPAQLIRFGSMLILVVMVSVVIYLAKNLRPAQSVIAIGIFLLSYRQTINLHEYIHRLALKFMGFSPTTGIIESPAGKLTSTSTPGSRMTSLQISIVQLSPLIANSSIFGFTILLYRTSLPYLIGPLALNLVSSGGDMAAFIFVLRQPRGSMFIDQEDCFEVIFRTNTNQEPS